MLKRMNMSHATGSERHEAAAVIVIDVRRSQGAEGGELKYSELTGVERDKRATERQEDVVDGEGEGQRGGRREGQGRSRRPN